MDRCSLCGGGPVIILTPASGLALCLRCVRALEEGSRGRIEAENKAREKQRAALAAVLRRATGNFLGQEITPATIEALGKRLQSYALIADQLVEHELSDD